MACSSSAKHLQGPGMCTRPTCSTHRAQSEGGIAVASLQIACLFVGAVFREVCGRLLFEADVGFTGEGLLLPVPNCTQRLPELQGLSKMDELVTVPDSKWASCQGAAD